MKKIAFLLFLVYSLSLQSQTVKIAAAANLRYILDEIKVKYMTQNPKAEILVNLGSSGSFYQQIMNGADYDLFMAADKTFPDKLKAQHFAASDVKTYAFGKLVLWSNVVDVSKGMAILSDKSVKHIAVAKPELAPYGKRAVECLQYYKLFDPLKSKIVYADNIAQTAQFAQTGNAEVAFLALALAISPDMKGHYFPLDLKSYKPVEQAMVLLKGKQRNPEAEKFMKFVLGDACKPIFKKYGFIVP